MAEARDELAARKRLLLALSTLHRLEIQHEARALRESIFTPRTAVSIATSSPVRALLVGAFLMLARRRGASRWARRALSVFTFLKTAGAWLRTSARRR